jgi:methionyl-tRNA formyltransferase
MKITILTDNPNSWILPYVDTLREKLIDNHEVVHIFSQTEIQKGDILFLLSCENIIKKETLSLNKNNIVIHPSDLPKGRGWSPLAWQIIEGVNEIPISLFEAVESVDAGDIYIKDIIKLEGHDLNDEIKNIQGEKTINMAIRYVNLYPMAGLKQVDTDATYYKKRKDSDNKLDIEKSIKEQFNLLRIVDNEKYPAHFEIEGKKYFIKIYKK